MLKAAAPGRFSFAVFVFSQGLIDLEVGVLWIVTGEPLHPYLHTYLDAAQARWLGVAPEIGLRAAAGAFLGAYSHVFIDSMMHSDMRPLRPFSEAGRLAHLIPVDTLQWLCVACGVLGAAVLFLGRRR